MALVKMTVNKRKLKWTNGTLNLLLSKRLREKFGYGEYNCVKNSMRRMYEINFIYTENFDELVNDLYGESENKEEDIEYKFASILTALWLISLYDSNVAVAGEKKALLNNVKARCEFHFPEYKIIKGDEHYEYEATNKISVENNLSDVETKIADPIRKLTDPMLNENEKIGLISKINSKIEKMSSSRTKHLNNTDKNILDSQKRSLQHLINKVDSAKGHASDSTLTINDIAYHVATSASLIHKLLNENQDQ